MAPESASRSTPALLRGLDTSAGADFVRERLALQGRTLFLVSFAFWIFLIANLVLVGGAPLGAVLSSAVALGHIAGSSMMGLVWLLARRRRISLLAVGALDSVGLVIACGCLAFMTMEAEEQILQVLLATTVTVMIRAILVPSTPVRTLLLTALAFVPIVLVCLLLHHGEGALPGFSPGFQKLHMSLNTVLWSMLGVTLATVTSQVTYGLRQQVAEAADIGQYTLEARIGGGGMGEVWRARHRLLIRPAAVKLIRRGLPGSPAGDPELLMRRFEREARATAALKSPHTVQLYDFGVTEDGTLYYVMELLDGIDLDTLVARHGPLPSERVIHILRQVLSSLADAHANGLVHRDIKPANIVVSRVGTAFDFAKVLDFGLVKLEGGRRASADDPLKLTADNTAGGTPAFMAPEVVLGEPAADHRVDIYSLGCVAYWLLTGRLVFEGRSAVEVMFGHAHTAPPRPSQRVELPIPPPLEDLIMACLEKEPDKRPASADIVSARLEACAVATPWTPERAEKWWTAHMPSASEARPVADILLSHEGRPMKLGRVARPRG
jgi:serine/threonine protein kinase